MRTVVGVVPLDDLMLELQFDNGEVRLFDIKPYLKGSLFKPLKDKRLFRLVGVEKAFGGLEWPNGADLCPDMLYMNSRHKSGARLQDAAGDARGCPGP